MVIYPAPDRIISYNKRAITEFRVKRADKHQVLSAVKIYRIVRDCEEWEGDIYDKAVLLLRKITQEHAFASGNRRTAVLVVKEFLTLNYCSLNIPDDPRNSRVLQGVREGFYTHRELKRWLQHGKIKPFHRK